MRKKLYEKKLKYIFYDQCEDFLASYEIDPTYLMISLKITFYSRTYIYDFIKLTLYISIFTYVCICRDVHMTWHICPSNNNKVVHTYIPVFQLVEQKLLITKQAEKIRKNLCRFPRGLEVFDY